MLLQRHAFALALAFLASISFGDQIAVRVKVVDAGGNPVVKAAVASEWMPTMPAMKLPLIPVGGLVTGPDGVAEGKIEGNYPIVLSAFDQAKHLGGFVSINKDTKEAVITLALMQPVQFEIAFAGTAAPLKNPWMEVQLVVPIGDKRSTARPAYVFPLSKDPIYLPVGSYRFIPGAENADAKEQWFEVPATRGVFHTPKFTLTVTKVAALTGKPAPEITVVGAMNVVPKVNLSDYKGKWVLIDFWGTWCSACRSGMPRLIDFYNQNKAKRSQFELLSLHDSSLKTVKTMKAEIAKIVKGQWKGKTLPFPVLLDQGGKTVEAYGISAFPTQVLIDPQGNIVEGGNLEMLKKKLGASATH